VRERLRSKEKDGWSLVDARVKIKHVFFFVFKVPPTEPVRFGWGFVSFRFLKPKPNRIEIFFKKFNRFFFTVWFFWLFFLGFLDLGPVCFCVSKVLLIKFEIFLFFY